MTSTTEKQLRLLSLDGGGVRGLASLQVLKMLLSKVESPKPCKFFDMICGTSTGGLIAIMLGVLEMTIDDCITAFSLMLSKAFVQKNRSRLSWKGSVQARYSTAALEECIKNIIAQEGKTGAKMKDGKDHACKVVIVAMDMQSKNTVHFTNYPTPGVLAVYENITVIDAALATTAATSFFENKVITTDGIDRVFGDAAIGKNNPVNSLWKCAREEFGNDMESRIRCLVSIGTGSPGDAKLGKHIKDVVKSIVQIAEATEVTGEDFRGSNGLANRGVYYRFNPPGLYDTVKMDDYKMGGNIQSLAQAYLDKGETGEKIEKFQRDNDNVQMAEEHIPYRRMQPVSTRLFDNLSNKHLAPSTNYWRHLTLEGYKNYERIYNACFPADERMREGVSFIAFVYQFRVPNTPTYDPPYSQISEVWSRLLTRNTYSSATDSSQLKGLAMATIYMLHIETSTSLRYEQPKMSDGRTGVDRDRREVLKRFAKWVPCKCTGACGKTWNFVNDVGLSQGGEEGRCGVVKLMKAGGARGLWASKDVKALELMKVDWYKKVV